MPFNHPQDFDFARWAPLAALGPEGDSLLRAALPLDAVLAFHFAHFAAHHFAALHPVEPPHGSARNFGPQAQAETDAFLSRVITVHGDEMFARDAQERRPSQSALHEIMSFAGQDGLFEAMIAIGACLDRQPAPMATPVLEAIVRETLLHGFNSANWGLSEHERPAWTGMWTALGEKHREEALRTPAFWSSLFESPSGALPNSRHLADGSHDLSFLARLGFFCEDMRPMLSARVLEPNAFGAFSKGLVAQAKAIDKFGHKPASFLLQMERFQTWLPLTARHWSLIADACAAAEAQGETCSILRAIVEAVQLRETVVARALRGEDNGGLGRPQAGDRSLPLNRTPRL